MITEREYLHKVSIDHRKRFAQFFTPEPIAAFMATWLMRGLSNHANILDPAYGLGVFSRVLHQFSPEVSVKGFELDSTIYKYAKQNLPNGTSRVHLIQGDYLESSWSDYFDGIICNPPYLKFHDYDNNKYISLVNERLNTKLNGFTNLYTLFLLKSIAQLSDGGRLVYIVPSEFLNADYGVEVKRALIESGTLRHVVVVDFTQNAFDDALTTVCILFCSKDKSTDEVRFSKIDNINALTSAFTNYTSLQTRKLNPTIKWKQYYETTQADNYHHLVPFSKFAKVSRGIATGANQYFTFNISKIEDNNLPEECFLPCICHSADVKNQIFTSNDFHQLADANHNVYLFNAKAKEENPHVRYYLRLGEKKEINKRYLTASRSPWYSIEQRKPAPIWVSVFNRNGLRFVRNLSGAYNLTTFHCVYNTSDIDTDILFAYLSTDIARKIFLDNSRQYGNGLVKFEPNDLNRGLIVDLQRLSKEEKILILETSKLLQHGGNFFVDCINLLNEFFCEKYGNTDGVDSLQHYVKKLSDIKQRKVTPKKIARGDKSQVPHKKTKVKQLNFFDLFDQYAFEPIMENSMAKEDMPEYGLPKTDNDKRVLISLVKKDNEAYFLDGELSKIYYTGKRFPSTVALNKLYYFMPYIKGKGIRDLYLIKIARVGTRKEGQPDNDPKDFRLVFELEFIKQLFDEYKPAELEIWHTFTDTTMRDIR